jgi:Lipocalin-like domain
MPHLDLFYLRVSRKAKHDFKPPDAGVRRVSGRGIMKTRYMVALSMIAGAALAAALLPSGVVAQEVSLKELVGSWIFVSAEDVKPDGSKVDSWGPNPKGAAMYDANGRFTFMIMRSDLPKFASNNRAQATAEEGKAVAQGMIAFYGTYTVNEADKTLTTRIEGSSYPNLIGGEQKRVITSLTADELRYTNPTTSTGTKAESVWRRAK